MDIGEINFSLFTIIMSDWIKFVKRYAAKNGISYKDALVQAAPHYKRGGFAKQPNRFPKKYARGAAYPRYTYDISDFIDRGNYDYYDRSDLKNRINRNLNVDDSDLRLYNQALNAQRSGDMASAKDIYNQMYTAGVLLGGYLGGEQPAPKGALAALLSGLNATIKVD